MDYERFYTEITSYRQHEVMLIGIAFLEVLLLALKCNELPTILLAAEILRCSVQNAWISLLLAQESVCHVIFRFRNI
jgi:hypothetical protein